VGGRGRGRGQWGEMTQALYAHMNNKRKNKKRMGSLSSLRCSWRSFKRRLKRTYKNNCKNVKTPQKKHLRRYTNI
jgi:hypothetical protein